MTPPVASPPLLTSSLASSRHRAHRGLLAPGLQRPAEQRSPERLTACGCGSGCGSGWASQGRGVLHSARYYMYGRVLRPHYYREAGRLVVRAPL